MTKPTIKTARPANAYASPHEKIMSVTVGRGSPIGCLLSVRQMDDGRLILEAYRADEGKVFVRINGQDIEVPS